MPRTRLLTDGEISLMFHRLKYSFDTEDEMLNILRQKPEYLRSTSVCWVGGRMYCLGFSDTKVEVTEERAEGWGSRLRGFFKDWMKSDDAKQREQRITHILMGTWGYHNAKQQLQAASLVMAREQLLRPQPLLQLGSLTSPLTVSLPALNHQAGANGDNSSRRHSRDDESVGASRRRSQRRRTV